MPHDATNAGGAVLRSPLLPKLTHWIRRSLVALLRPLTLRRRDANSRWERLQSADGQRFQVPAKDLAHLPAGGALITLSNQPYGDKEEGVLRRLLTRQRGDMRLLRNDDLLRRTRLRDNGESGRYEVRDSARAWLAGGHALALLPGGVRSRFQPHQMRVTEARWQGEIASLVRESGATVVPIAFATPNPLFCALRWLPRFIRDWLGAEGQPLRVRIGQPIEARELSHIETESELMDTLHLRTHLLLGDKERNRARKTLASDNANPSTSEALALRSNSEALRGEIDQLREAGYQLLSQGEIDVFCAPRDKLDAVMHEIGRLRELTFRAVGEGTGKALDISDYDERYHHLFLWHREDQEVVGGYRLGCTDRILPDHGSNGLYSSRLFAYQQRFFDEIGPAIELGRSFVQPRYQRSYSPLSLLWKGIGAFIVENPRYQSLFGPVSISIEYLNTSKQLMIAYLEAHAHAPELARFVKAKSPPRLRKIKGWELQAARKAVRNIEDLSKVVASTERDGKGVPVLLRQYIKMGARMLAMNVDAGFSDVLDGLMVIDLRQSDPRVLRRYMGDHGVEAFLAWHGVGGRKPASALS